MIKISGTKVAELMAERNWSQTTLVQKTGANKDTIGSIVRSGLVGSWRTPVVANRLAVAFGVPLDELVVSHETIITAEDQLPNELEREFWQALRAYNYQEACRVVNSILASVLTAGSQARWENNHAFSLVQLGSFSQAEGVLRDIHSNPSWPHLSDPERVIVAGNLAWVCYHNPLPGVRKFAQSLKPILISAIDNCPSRQGGQAVGWLQIWSRHREAEAGLVPPYYVLARLLASEDNHRGAVQALKQDVKTQGQSAVGSLILLGFLGPSISEVKMARTYLAMVDPANAPVLTREHQAANHEFAVWMTEKNVLATEGPDNSFYLAQAVGLKSEYYAHACYADVINFLQADVLAVQRMRAEYITRVVQAYSQAGKANLSPIILLNREKGNKRRMKKQRG